MLPIGSRKYKDLDIFLFCLSQTPSGPEPQTQSQVATDTDTAQLSAHTFRETPEVVEDSEPSPRRYPVRQRVQPERFGILCYPLGIRDEFFEEGSNVID